MSLLHSVKAYNLARLVAEWNPYPGHDIWDDLVVPATLVNPVGLVGAPSYNDTTRTVDFSASADNRIDLVFQLPHGCVCGVAGAVGRLHFHVVHATAHAGNSRWQLSWEVANDNAAAPGFTTDAAFTLAAPGNSNLVRLQMKDMDLSGAGISSIVTVTAVRTASHGDDDYNQIIRLKSADMHIRRQRAGSRQEAVV